MHDATTHEPNDLDGLRQTMRARAESAEAAEEFEDPAERRDLFAVFALSGILSANANRMLLPLPADAARHAYAFADAMTAERVRRAGPDTPAEVGP